MSEFEFDAIVVGSGISGGWAAKELTEKGLKVLMLERGRNFEHLKDYTNSQKEFWDWPHRGTRTRKMIEQYPVLSRDYLMDENLMDYWPLEEENPYTEIKRFDWYRSYQMGGRSIMWGRQSYRLSNFDFEANAKDGIGTDWPVRYEEIAPWYDHVEKFAGINGSHENLPQLPDGMFQPAMKMNCVEQDLSAKLKSFYNGKRVMIMGRSANLTETLPGRNKCQYRDKCALGCPFSGYFSTQSSTLPAALKTGNLTIHTWSIVTRILYDRDSKKATGVEVLDARTNKTYEYRAKIVFLNASTLNSTWILMNSATDIWPDGLGSSSGELGHNLMDHHVGAEASGDVEGYTDKYYYGRRPNGIYIPRFRNLFGDKRDYLRGFGYQGSAGRQGWNREVAEYLIGKELKDLLTEPGNWRFGIGAFGEMLPYHENRLSLDKSRKDKWGLPTLAVDCEIKENEKKMRKDMVGDAVEMLEAIGIKNIQSSDEAGAPGRAIHEMGTARMGREPGSSVLNKWNQVWDAKNVFVTDGAFMTSSACQNPSLTYMAFTARAANFAVEELKRGNL
ncbi:GMC oxidoreductase [Flavihumibacter stibioxidans]|uniref:GMC family oxidoreductase n=1 Tax=Flavihumibacter stibioxidans TaxID=1834163 RepID=A0ABR7M952_9BACT|nr:GMC family oxidoreductase [Flavihumibacter stibioxidans]MBC6491477.1 GMC family oxidoreductase [Flavihumibacter stibioxidans]